MFAQPGDGLVGALSVQDAPESDDVHILPPSRVTTARLTPSAEEANDAHFFSVAPASREMPIVLLVMFVFSIHLWPLSADRQMLSPL